MTQHTSLQIKRHDLSTNKSLRAWSAADEMLADWVIENATSKEVAIYHDRFGYLSCFLNEFTPITYTQQHSQIHAIEANLRNNNLKGSLHSLVSTATHKADTVTMKLPKSLALFEFMLWHAHQHSSENATVVCGFMTRHFTKGMLSIAEKYFEDVSQSRAAKKARLLVLRNKKPLPAFEPTSQIEFNDSVYQQYKGVFSANHIDYATQYLLPHISMPEEPKKVLDLASGNGVIAKELSKKWKDCEYHLIDDSELAVASAKLNLSGENIHHHYHHELSELAYDYFDLIVSNPPFHFEHDININIPLALFKQAHQKLKNGGSFQCVANTHLNYATHLVKLFSSVKEVTKNDRFVVYACMK